MKRFLALMVAVCVVGFVSAEEASAQHFHGHRGVSAFSIGIGGGGWGVHPRGFGGFGGYGFNSFRPAGFSVGYSSFRPSYGFGRPVYGGWGGGWGGGGFRGCGW